MLRASLFQSALIKWNEARGIFPITSPTRGFAYGDVFVYDVFFVEKQVYNLQSDAIARRRLVKEHWDNNNTYNNQHNDNELENSSSFSSVTTATTTTISNLAELGLRRRGLFQSDRGLRIRA